MIRWNSPFDAICPIDSGEEPENALVEKQRKTAKKSA